MNKKNAALNNMRSNHRNNHSVKVYSSVFTVVAVICTVLICLFADLAGNKYALKADLSYNGQTVQTKITDGILEKLDTPVKIIMLSSGQSDYDAYYNETASLKVLLNRYTAKSTYVSFEETRLVTDPHLAEQYIDGLGRNSVSNECLIVYCETTDRARILVSDDFYSKSYDSELGAYVVVQNYESVITQAILYVTTEELPVAQFMTGHGEVGEANLGVMTGNLQSANYDIVFIRLDTDEPDPDYPLFIISPRMDFSEKEVQMLERYALNGGDFFITCDTVSEEKMPNFCTFLRNWGIQPIAGILVAEQNTSDYIENPLYIVPYLQNTDATASLIAADENVFLLVNCMAFNSTASIDGSYKVTRIMRSGLSHVTIDTRTMAITDDDQISNHDIALLSERVMPGGEMSRLFIIGNTEIFINGSLNEITSAKPFLLEMTQYIRPYRNVSLGISPRTTKRAAVTQPSLLQAIILVFLLPLIVLIPALIILLPRRHK